MVLSFFVNASLILILILSHLFHSPPPHVAPRSCQNYHDSEITATKAVAYLEYNGILDVKYEWDITTGMLSRKEVTAPSGLQLVVVPGKGKGMDGLTFESLVIAVAVCGLLVHWRKRRHRETC